MHIGYGGLWSEIYIFIEKVIYPLQIHDVF